MYLCVYLLSHCCLIFVQLWRKSSGQAAVCAAVLHPGAVPPQPAGRGFYRLLLYLPLHPLHHVHQTGNLDTMALHLKWGDSFYCRSLDRCMAWESECFWELILQFVGMLIYNFVHTMSFTATQHCSILLHNWSGWGLDLRCKKGKTLWFHAAHPV